jgi:hypothetical protein
VGIYDGLIVPRQHENKVHSAGALQGLLIPAYFAEYNILLSTSQHQRSPSQYPRTADMSKTPWAL